MRRKLYGWERNGKFYLSAFIKPRDHDGKRPALSFDDRETLDAEVTKRQAELVWEDGN